MARRPCVECPWRVDVEPGQFPPERYEELRRTTGTQGNEAPYGAPMFACHKAPPGEEFVCAGWLASVGYWSLTARVAAAHGTVPRDGFEPGEGWPALHESYAALLAVHGEESSHAAGRSDTCGLASANPSHVGCPRRQSQ